MPGAANDVWWDDLRQEAELPPPAPARSKAPMVLGVIGAAAVAGAVGWWLASPGQTHFDNPTIQAARAPVVRAAAPVADAEQVRRAYEEFGLVYANSGADGLARFNESCEASLRADPRILDFCLAFDLFAGAVEAPGAEPPGKAQARRMAMVQAALPGADPDVRLSEVRRLMREASGVAAAQTETAPPAGAAPAQVARIEPAERAEPARTITAPPAKPVRVAKAAPPRKAAATGGQACRLKSTPADRLMCANPTLRVQERRMKAAYERALAAGADPLAVDAAQAEWRALRNAADTRGELADLYARRTRELNATAEAATRTPPT